MNLQNLRIFLKVAELEHVTRAAEELHLSQPAVTKMIHSLEQEVYLKLIERQGRRIALTNAGRVLKEYAQQLFSLEREMEDALKELRDVEGGEVRLAFNRTAGVYLLPLVVSRFRARYPQVTLHISILNSPEIVQALLNWQLDFGLVESDTSICPPELQVEMSTSDELILVVAPTHKWSKLQVLPVTALNQGELILREEESVIRVMIEQELERHEVQIHSLFTLTDNEAVKQMVISGVGAAIISAFSVQRELMRGELVHVPVSNLNLRPQLCLMRRADRRISPAAQAFCAVLSPILEHGLEAIRASTFEGGR
ncbi:LysR family transcriptional regulator [Ktedonobacter sp. SOSP1-52]|uniref:LysR family transcriptional regulator n=1 Tax=Ktedonobacter sp. SOSP1-52 TaxID=2778366 RepID=UPI0019169DF3|nr:LysR substrate-binding domain-containing protein [Ktedonobacter sp. SOSP1-52]GHO67651.1 LysR family transcriptional regulator [Ktedonobacter sp. SOSP1-52]